MGTLLLSSARDDSSALTEAVGFIAVCLLVFAALFGGALAFERFLMKRRAISRVRRLTYTALFSSMAAVLMLFELALPFAPGFYKLDLSELPVMICSFYLGPVAGVTAELVKVLLKLLIKGTTTAFVGDFANFAVGCAFVLPASLVYHARPGRRNALLGLITGTLVMTVFGSAFNALYLIPRFAELFGMPLESIVAMGTAVNGAIVSVPTLVLYAVVPFNLVKGVLVSLVTFFVYKPVSRALSMELTRKPPAKNG